MSYNKKMISGLLCVMSLGGFVTVANAMEKQVALKTKEQNKPVLRTEQWTPQAKDVLVTAQMQEESNLTLLGKLVKDAEKKNIQPVPFDPTPTAADYLRRTGTSERFKPKPVIENTASKKALTEARVQKRQDEQDANKVKVAQVLSERKSEIDAFDTFELVVEKDKPSRSHRNKSRKPAVKTASSSHVVPASQTMQFSKEAYIMDETSDVLPQEPKKIAKSTTIAPRELSRAPRAPRAKREEFKSSGPSQNILTRAKRQQLAEQAIDSADDTSDSEFLPQLLTTPVQSPAKGNEAPFSVLRPATLRDRQEDDRIDLRTLAVIKNSKYSDKTADERFLRNFIDGKK